MVSLFRPLKVTRLTCGRPFWKNNSRYLGSRQVVTWQPTTIQEKRIEEYEESRPVIFIARSLGVIVVKQALIWANTAPHYSDHTLGIGIFGTPHQGSGEANDGNVLANVAKAVMHKPKLKLVKELRSNSDRYLNGSYKAIQVSLVPSDLQILRDKGHEGIFEFFEKHPVVLVVSGEDQLEVSLNDRDMCKFGEREIENFTKPLSTTEANAEGKG